MLTWLLGALALAHPIGGAHFGDHLTVVVTEERVEVYCLTEIPALQLLDEWAASLPAGDKASMERAKQEELAAGLVLEADGTWLPTTLLDAGAVDYGPDTVVVPVRLAADLPAGAHTLRISDGNYPEVPVTFFRQVWLGPHWQLEQVPPGLGVWRRDQGLRELTLNLRPTGPARRLWAPAGLRGASVPLGVSVWPWGALGGLLAMLTLWSLSRRRRRRTALMP